MRNILIGRGIGAAALALMITTPAAALGLGDLAKVVLGGNSVLKKGEQKCGSSLGLTKDDSLAMTFARAAVERSLPISQFSALDKSAEADATSAANAPTFCNETKKKKSGMMKAITKAGKSILKQKAFGGLGL
jgi:antitoxin component of RelBE/YafQ-DinJ toxin-antitoxin module